MFQWAVIEPLIIILVSEQTKGQDTSEVIVYDLLIVYCVQMFLTGEFQLTCFSGLIDACTNSALLPLRRGLGTRLPLARLFLPHLGDLVWIIKSGTSDNYM